MQHYETLYVSKSYICKIGLKIKTINIAECCLVREPLSLLVKRKTPCKSIDCKGFSVSSETLVKHLV